MKWDSLITKLYQKLEIAHRSGKNDGYLSTTELEDYGRAQGYSASNAGRRVRDLYKANLVEKRPKFIESKGVWIEEYRWRDLLKNVILKGCAGNEPTLKNSTMNLMNFGERLSKKEIATDAGDAEADKTPPPRTLFAGTEAKPSGGT